MVDSWAEQVCLCVHMHISIWISTCINIAQGLTCMCPSPSPVHKQASAKGGKAAAMCQFSADCELAITKAVRAKLSVEGTLDSPGGKRELEMVSSE